MVLDRLVNNAQGGRGEPELVVRQVPRHVAANTPDQRYEPRLGNQKPDIRLVVLDLLEDHFALRRLVDLRLCWLAYHGCADRQALRRHFRGNFAAGTRRLLLGLAGRCSAFAGAVSCSGH